MLQSVLLLIASNTELQIKQVAECPQQITTNCKHISWRTFQLLQLFLRLSGFPNIFDKLFLINVKFFQLDCGSNANKTSFWRDINGCYIFYIHSLFYAIYSNETKIWDWFLVYIFTIPFSKCKTLSIDHVSHQILISSQDILLLVYLQSCL